jgi:RNA polymerase sigma-H factor
VSASPERETSLSCDYDDMLDEEIVEAARAGEREAEEYLITKYKNFVRAKARSYFLIGADRDDIVQEGMIGLFKAIRDFRSDKLASFRAFAELCITRQIITAIKTATRQKTISQSTGKNQGLNNNAWLQSQQSFQDQECSLTVLLSCRTSSCLNLLCFGVFHACESKEPFI